MPGSFLVLLRYLLRVDGVVYRIIDTRLWHAFGTDVLVREHVTKEAPGAAIERVRASLRLYTCVRVQSVSWLSAFFRLSLRLSVCLSVCLCLCVCLHGCVCV
jgi:hypothetical protein